MSTDLDANRESEIESLVLDVNFGKPATQWHPSPIASAAFTLDVAHCGFLTHLLHDRPWGLSNSSQAPYHHNCAIELEKKTVGCANLQVLA